MAESEAKINKYIDQDLAAKIGDLLDRGIHPGHQDFLPALDLKAGMGSHEAIVPRDEYGAFGRWTRNTFGYPKGEQALAEAQQLAKNLGGHMLLARGAALEKARSEGQGAPPTFETAQQQNPTVYGASGIQPPQQTQEMLGPPAPGQTEPMPSITGPNMQAPLQPPQRAAYMMAMPHAAAFNQPKYTEEDIKNPMTPLPAGIRERQIEMTGRIEAARAQAINKVGTDTQNAIAQSHGFKLFTDAPPEMQAKILREDAARMPQMRMDINLANLGKDVIPPASANLHGQDYLNTLNPGMRNLVQGIVDNTIPITTLSSRTGERKAILEHAKQVDPNFDVAVQPAKAALRKDFTSGKAADNIVALDQGLNHMGTLLKLNSAMQNGNVPAINALVNAARTQTGDPRVNNFDTAKQAVGTELMRVFRQVNASEVETKAWEERFKAASSPQQLQGAVQTGAKLLEGRINALNNKWNKGMGTTTGYPQIVSPEASAVLSSLGINLGRASGGGGADILSQADAILKGK